MNYRLTIRRPDESDLGRDCPYLPDDEEFVNHCEAMLQDIKEIPGVNEAKAEKEDELVLETQFTDSAELKARLMPLFQREFGYVRFSSLRQL
jgi:hypothetical protein